MKQGNVSGTRSVTTVPEVSAGRWGGSARLVAELNQVDFFGECALLTGEPRSAPVRATLDVPPAGEKGGSEGCPGRGMPSFLSTLSRSFPIMFARATRDRAGDADIPLFPMIPALPGVMLMGTGNCSRGEKKPAL